MTAAVFLDRDGTLNARPPAHQYIGSVDEFVWLPGAREGLARLSGAGYLLAVASNQRGVARGIVPAGVLPELEERIQRDLAAYGCRIEAFRYCVHDLDDGCACRKPAPGLILGLAAELGVRLSESWMIGDSESDVLAGKAAGCRTVLLAPANSGSQADVVASSLLSAAAIVAGPRASTSAA
jgi:D-glycero-D-manno-heptose 1,7-bisphosphate phosphatase